MIRGKRCVKNEWQRWSVVFHHPYFPDKPVVVTVERAKTANQAKATALRSKSTRLMVFCFGGNADNWEARAVPERCPIAAPTCHATGYENAGRMGIQRGKATP